MYDYEYYYNLVKEKLLSFGESGKRRFEHSIGVALESEKLARIYYKDDLGLQNKAKVAGILHDYAKYLTLDEFQELAYKHGIKEKLDNEYISIYHGLVGYLLIEDELDFHDKEILNAIIYHSTGHKEMTFLEKVLFVADYTEPNRVGDFFDEVRKYAYDNLDYAVFLEAKMTYDYLKNINKDIFYLTLECYEYYKEILENK